MSLSRSLKERYKSRKKIGVGSFGSVYKCVVQATGETIAVKQVELFMVTKIL